MHIFLEATLLLMLIAVFPSVAEDDDPWELRKDRDGIQVYTREREGSGIYMYKVVTAIHKEPEEIFEQLVDFRENLKYMKLVDSLAFLDHRKKERYINYMRFDMPWPVKDREMVMDMRVTFRPDVITLESDDLPDRIQSNGKMIQIEDFHEEWELRSVPELAETRITVTGWINPGGSIPKWVVNMFSVRTPFRFISGILEELNKE
ncbi:MAG: hypothetical protein ACQER7_10170 [Bacteroidota bacterium]